jgi:hypothetical protein
MISAYLNDEVDELQFPHLLHLEVSDKKTYIVTLPHINTSKKKLSDDGNDSRITERTYMGGITQIY